MSDSASGRVSPPDLTQPLTLEQVEQWLEQTPHHLVRYAGHAVFNRERPEHSYLSLPRANGEPGPIHAPWLHSLLVSSPAQFLYLSCCSGAEIGSLKVETENTYLGPLDAAVQADVPAILGYCWPVVGRPAAAFATHFYEGLTKYPLSLEHAAWWARKQIFETSTGGGWDEAWFSPMLVIQNPDYPGGDNA